MEVLDRILKYARKCISGEIASGQKHKWACERLIRDVQRIGSEGFPYVWDDDAAQNIIEWFALLRHSKGVLAGEPIILTDWQCFRLCQLYGWKHKDTGKRRFKKTFTEVARKNAKSQEEAGVALYEISVTAVKNNEVAEAYTAGTKKDQSRIVFEEARLMLRGSPLRTKFNLNRSEIVHRKTGSFIKPLSKEDGKTGDGTNPALLILDEYHQHATTDFYDLGMGSGTKEPLLMIITTAGKDLTFPCYVEEYQMCSKLLDPNVDTEDDEYLVDICELDPEDYADITNVGNEELWIKANPIRATYPEGLEKIRGDYRVAKEIPEKMTSFLTKMMDIWVQAKDYGYMNMAKWKACEVDEIPIDTKGMPVYVGFDMSSKLDLTSVAFVIPYKTDLDDGLGKNLVRYIVYSHSFIPSREKLMEHVAKDKAAYDAWERAGFITVTDTPIVDQGAVMRYVLMTCEANDWKIQSLCFDPANAAKLMMDLSDEGFECVEVYQSHKSLNEATQGFREQVHSRNIVYTYNPVLNYAMSNAVIRQNNGLIKIDKDATTKRIDPVDAVLCAYKLAMFHIFRRPFEDEVDDFLENY
jgi:phage terminase large subunit-like protein